MKISGIVKQGTKCLFGTLLTLTLIGQFLTADLAHAASPQFNFQVNDSELLRGTNKTTNQQDWVDPVSGNAGDTFAGLVFYHNGVLGSTANNVRVKVNIPAQTSNKTALITASISADNAPTVTDTVIGGQIIGKSGLTVNLDQDATLALVPGSVKWFPDFISFGLPNVAIPFGQSGDEVTSANGLKIGDIQGCWQHIGYVSFRFKTERITLPSLAIAKTVRNVTAGETAFVEQNQAKPGDILEYSVKIQNSGSGSADNLYLTDTIPANTTFVGGSTTIARNGGTFSGLADGVAGDGMSLGTLASNQNAEVRFRVQVGQGVTNGQTLTNTAFLHFDKEVFTDTATTIVNFAGVATPKTPQLPKTGDESGMIAILSTMTAGLSYAYLKYRKALKTLLSHSK